MRGEERGRRGGRGRASKLPRRCVFCAAPSDEPGLSSVPVRVGPAGARSSTLPFNLSHHLTLSPRVHFLLLSLLLSSTPLPSPRLSSFSSLVSIISPLFFSGLPIRHTDRTARPSRLHRCPALMSLLSPLLSSPQSLTSPLLTANPPPCTGARHSRCGTRVINLSPLLSLSSHLPTANPPACTGARHPQPTADPRCREAHAPVSP